MRRWIFIIWLLAAYARAAGLMPCRSADLDPAKASDYCSERKFAGTLKLGEMCLVRPDNVRPTQYSVGKVAAHCHVRFLEAYNKAKIKKVVDKNILPAVLGPEDRFYITDRHHLAYAMFEAQFRFENFSHFRVMKACVMADYSEMEIGDFWKTMEDQGMALLQDEKGAKIKWQQLPTGLKHMADDPYRTLARWVRSSNGYIKCRADDRSEACKKTKESPYYLEYTWGNFFRWFLPNPVDHLEPHIHDLPPEFIYNTDLQTQIQALKELLPIALEVALSPYANLLPGFNRYLKEFPPAVTNVSIYGCDRDDEH